MGMEVEHQHAENTYPREQAYSRVYAAIPENTIIGPVLHVNMVKFLDNCGIELSIHSTATQDQTSWVMLDTEERTDTWRIHLSKIQDEPTRVRNCYWKDQSKNPSELCDVEMESFSASIAKPIATRTEKSVEGIEKPM